MRKQLHIEVKKSSPTTTTPHISYYFKRVIDLKTFVTHRRILAILVIGRWVRAIGEDIRRLV